MAGLMPDGSWKDHAEENNRLTRFVREIRRARRAGDIPLAVVLNRIEAEGFERAFPSLAVWREREQAGSGFSCLPVQTSAESLVWVAFQNAKGEPTPCRDYDPRCAPQPRPLASREVTERGIATIRAAFEHFAAEEV